MSRDGTSASTVDRSRAGALEQALAEYLLASEAGAAPERDVFVAAHPELAGELRAFFEDEARLHYLADPLRPEASPEDPVSGGSTTTGSTHDVCSDGGRAAAAAAEVPQARVRYFGDYELLEEVGRGGMGVVYKARHLRLNRVVALKMILAGRFASAEDVKRFQVEAENAARLDHPNIVPVYEVGRHRGRRYFTMKLVTGGSLARRVAHFTEDPRRSAELIAEAARAVHHAHQHGILHRDIKPGNILLDAEGRPQVTDFGLARRLGGEEELTLPGAVLGSPRYMAPEQARGDKRLSVAADVYGLGAVLYELLTGRPPFSGESVLETLRQVREQEPARPSGIVRALDRDLETVCLKCMEKDPQARYASAEALQRDLEHWLRGEPLAARPAPPWERVVKWARRNPARAALGVVSSTGVVSLVGVVLAGNMLLSQKQGQTDAALKREQSASARAQTEAAKARAVGRFLREMLGSANPWDGLSRDVRVREVLDAAVARVDAGELNDQPEVEAEVRMTLARTYTGLGIYAPGNVQLMAALRTLRTSPGDYAAEVSDCLLMLAENLMGQEDHPGAEAAARQAVAIRRETCRTRDLRLAEGLVGLGGVLRRRGRLSEAELALGEALSIVADASGSSPAGGAAAGDVTTVHRNTLGNLAHTMRRKGDYDAAERLFRQVLRIDERRYGRSHPTTAVTISDVAYVLKETRQDAEAEAMFREAIETLRTTLANDDPNITGNAGELIELLVRRKGGTHRGAALAELLAEERARNGERHPLVAQILESLAYFRRDVARDDAGAVAAFREALDVWRSCAGENSLGAGNTMMALAFTLHRLHQDDEVEPLYRRALAIRRTYHGGVHPDTIDTVRRLAEFLTDKGDYAAAEPLWLELHGWACAHPRNNWRFTPRFASGVIASFYRRWGKPDLAAAWEAKRDEAPPVGLPDLQVQVAELTARLEQVSDDGAADHAGPEAGLVAALRGARASFHARMGHFPEAAADCARAVQLDPASHRDWYLQACLLAYLGQADEYSRHCAAMRERFAESRSIAVLAKTSEACLLLPGRGGNPREAHSTLDRLAAALAPTEVFVRERAIADYRCGDFRSAIARVDRILEVDSDPQHRATAHLIKALACYRMGAVGEATSQVAEASRIIEADVPRAGRDDLSGIERWLLCHIFRREAEAAGIAAGSER